MAKFSYEILNHIGKAILNVSVRNTLRQFLQLVTTLIKVWSYWEVETSELFCLKEMRRWAWGGEN